MLAFYGKKYDKGMVCPQIGPMHAAALDKGKGRIYNIERNRECR